MKRAFALLVTASFALASQNVFSVYDDILAFPQVDISSPRFPGKQTLAKGSSSWQYEIIFSDSYISDTDAESRLAHAASSSSARSKATSLAGQDSQQPEDSAGELSQLRRDDRSYTKSDEYNSFDDATDNYEPMILNGRHYLCAIPIVETPVKNETSEAAARAEEEKELARATVRGWELLKDMEGHCMYFISGWWSYSFCYNTDVKQFHQLPPGKGAPIYPPTEDDTTPSYVLGRFGVSRDDQAEHEQTPAGISDGQGGGGGLEVAELQAKGEMRYLVQKLGGGTTCDLTGKERRVEVQVLLQQQQQAPFHCHPQSADRIGWIKEVTTCSYLMVIYTPRLCNDVAFLPPRENKANPIACREVIPTHAIPAWQARKAAEAERKQLQPGSGEKRPVVGGVEVGAMLKVGKEGRRIESSQVAGGGGGVKVDVVAKSDGGVGGGKVQRLSNEDLRKLSVDPETVDRLRKELQELAGDKAWKLEVVDAPNGVHELRGVVDGDGDGEQVQGQGEGEGEDEARYEGDGSEEEYKEEL
ncbi:MAG: Protein OS-9 [Pleopsidium flavum]|nr:MAG: Protein OS-9 [Pleopsidium flavum]